MSSNFKGIAGFSALLSLEVCLGSLLPRLRVSLAHVEGQKMPPCFIGSTSSGVSVIIMSSACFISMLIRLQKPRVLCSKSGRNKPRISPSKVERHLGVFLPLIFVVYSGP